MEIIFWTEDNFGFISDSRDSFNCKLKKLIREQIITFYSPSNALVHLMKHLKHHTFIGMCSLFTWFNLQILLMKTHRVLNRLRKCTNVRENLVFSWFYNQNSKNSAHYSWDIYQGNLDAIFNMVSWWVLWVGTPIIFHNSFFV